MRRVVCGFAFALMAGVTAPAFAQLPTTEQLPLPAGSTAAQSFDKRWDVIFNGESRYTFSKTTRDGSPDSRTRMFYTPFGFQLNGKPTDDFKVEFTARSGRVDARTWNGTTASSYVGFLDSSLSLTTTYLGWNGVQPFASLAVNLPTGKTVFGTPTFQMPDPDFFEVGGFGEGLNIGPTVGVNIPVMPNLILTFSGGFTSRGQFDRDGPGSGIGPMLGPIQRFNPGDVWTFNSALGYQAGAWSVQLAASHSQETTTTVDGVAFYRAGKRYSVSGSAGYAWNANLSSKISASFSHTNKNDIHPSVFPLGILVLEAFNSNTNVTTVGFDTTYKQGSFAIGPTLSFLYRDHNGYDPTTFQFVPAKTKWQGGGTAQYAVNEKLSFNGRVEYIWATFDSQPIKINVVPIPGSNVPPIYTTGWLFSLAAVLKL